MIRRTETLVSMKLTLSAVKILNYSISICFYSLFFSGSIYALTAKVTC